MFWTLLKKELRSIFKSPSIYVFGGVLSFWIGWLFFDSVQKTMQFPGQPILSSVVQPLFGNLNFSFLLLCPLLAMRSISEEKKNETLFFYYGRGIHPWPLVTAKYISLLISLFIVVTPAYLALVSISLSGFDDYGILLSNLLGIFLVGALFLSIGLWASSMTSSQVIAGVISLCLIFSMLLLYISSLSIDNLLLREIVQKLSFLTHFVEMQMGLLRLSSFVYFFSGIFLMLVLTTKSLDARNW